MTFDNRTRLFIILSAVFVTALIIGDIIGGKLMEVDAFGISFVISVGMLPFPITFLLTDLLNEFYGKKAAGFVTWVGFFLAGSSYLLLFLATKLPWAPFTNDASWGGMNASAFNNVFSGSQRILIASMTAYLIAQFSDIGVFHLIKRLTGNRFLWLRATGSTIVSQLIDTVVIQSLAWIGLLPVSKLISIIATSYVVKLLVAIGLTPLIYAGHAVVERRLGIEPVVLAPEGEGEATGISLEQA